MNKDTIVDWGKAFQGNIASLDFVFGGLLAGTVGGIIAPGGAGKSFLGLGICTCLTTKDILGLNIEPQDHQVCYVTAEDPKQILEHRALSLASHLNPQERERIQKFVTLQSIHGTTPCLINSKGERDEQWIGRLKRAATGKRLLIIDPLRKFHQGEENDSGHMTLLTQVLDEVASQTDCAILFLHHANKLTTLSGQGGSQAASRGSSALVDNIRYQLNLMGMTEQEAQALGVDKECRSRFVKLIGSKANYAENVEDHWLRRAEGGVLVKAVLDTPEKVKQAKKRKDEFNKADTAKDKGSNPTTPLDPSDPSSFKAAGEMSHKDIFG